MLAALLGVALLVATTTGGTGTRRRVLVGRTYRSGGCTTEQGLQTGELGVSGGRGAQVLGEPIGGLKVSKLLPCEEPPLACPQTVDGDGGKRGAGETDDGEPCLLPHPPDLLVPPFAQDELEPGVPSLPPGHDDLRGKRDSVFKHHAIPPLRDVIGRHVPLHLHEVSLGDMVTRVEHPRREVAVVGQQQGTTRLVVETTDRVDAQGQVLENLRNGGPPLRVVECGHDGAGLVHQDVDGALGDDALAVEFDAVKVSVGAGTELGDDFSVDAHASGLDQAFCCTPRRNPGAR
jgi:hypothetical protein